MDADSTEGKPKPDGSAKLSPEFFSGNTRLGLEKIRTRLLDLTNRNRLLNFRHSAASSLRIVDVDLDGVFRRLLDGERLPFLYVPEPSEPPIPSATDHAANLGWNTSYDLEGNEHARSRELPVLLYFEGLESLTRKLGSAARTAIEESGTNMLYLTFGFLEWYESDDSQQSRFVPLLTIPVALERGGNRGKGFHCTLEYSGEDLTTNISLNERVRRDFGVELPRMEDDDSPEQYFRKFDDVFAIKKRWQVRRQMTLSLLRAHSIISIH